MTPMIQRLREHLDSITPEQFQKEIEEIETEGYKDGMFNCKDLNCPHCAYETQEMWEDKLERDAAIDFAKWIAQDWTPIWFENKWMWECLNEQIEIDTKHGFLTEEQLYELYLKSC